MLSSCMLLVTLMVAGQAEASAEEAKNEHLLQFEPLIGEWKTDLASAVGEVYGARHTQWRWALGNQVIMQEWVTRNVDGTVTDRRISVLHWDPSDKKVKMWSFGKGGYPPANARATLVSADEDGFLFESRGTWNNGSQNVARLKLQPANDGKTYTWGWSKISGAGGSNAGPHVFERVD